MDALESHKSMLSLIWGKKKIMGKAGGGDWVVYLNYHGKKAPVRTLAYFSHKQKMIGAHSVKDSAISAAEVAALAIEKDAQL